MNSIEQKKIKNLLSQCKSELLNHTLQNKVVSPSIKNINLYLDECLTFLKAENTPPEIIYRNTRNSRSPKVYGEERENILFIAYCMSKLDYQFVNKITGEYYNQTEAFSFLAQKLKIKTPTLRNYRDAFDYHVKQLYSNRIGWKKELAPDLEKVKEKYDSFTESMLTGYAKDILKTC
ncbi:MAG: hypothetical protein methR_P3607 [Methyloprofundus sp.]|nr:MAG: hypothetical protein methR_P3607 [Methyloprofundus sp.]